MILRVALAAVCGVGLLALSGEAKAQYASNELGDIKIKHHESAQHFAIEARIAPYWPQVDSAPGLNGQPYRTVFGRSAQVEGAIEFDWQAIHIPHLGSLGPGASVGYMSASTPAPFTTCPATGSCISAENTTLEIYPIYLVGVFRLDVFLRDFHIPIVPYAKGGVGLAFWRASNDAGTSKYNGISGVGHTWGAQLAAGLAISLNWLDPRAARSLDESAGINNISIFGEGMFSLLNNFGANALYVGTNTVVGGLSIEF